MAVKQEFAKQLESQIAVWQAQIKEHQERLSQAGAEAKAGYEKSIATMRENAEQAGRLLNKVREASEAAWKDMQSASVKAFEEQQKGWAEAAKRFG